MKRYKEIGNRIRIAREDRGLTQKELGMILNCSEQSIGNYESGRRKISAEDLEKLAKHLNKPLTFFFGEDLTYEPMTARELDILEAMEDKNIKITAGAQPVTKDQRLSILRALIYPNKQETKPTVPVLGTIRAGIPLLSKQNIIGEVDIPADLEGLVDFALQVRGDSMIGAGIADGDIVLCKEDHSPNPGQVVVALVNIDETTLKFLIREGERDFLRAANPEYEDIELKPGDEIQGRVVKVIKDAPSVDVYRDYIYFKEEHMLEWNEVIEEAIAGGIEPDFAKHLIKNQIALASELARRKSP